MTSIKSQKNWFTASRSTKKNVYQLFGSGKKWFLGISSLTNTVAAIWRVKKEDPSYLETKKMQFTTVRSKEKDYDNYLKSEKTGSQPVGARKKNIFPAIWKYKKIGSQLFRA